MPASFRGRFFVVIFEFFVEENGKMFEGNFVEVLEILGN
jgi:hypothetical protein